MVLSSSKRFAFIIAVCAAYCVTHVTQALSADEKAMQLVRQNCKFPANGQGWPLAVNAGACSLRPSPYLVVKCDSNKKYITELTFGFTPAATFDCLTPTLRRLTMLQKLQFAGSGFKGVLPAAWGGLGNLQASLRTLSVRDSFLTGTLPDRWGNLQQLRKLEVTGRDCCLSALDGPLPAIWGRLRRLQYLNIMFNQISATLPPEWGNMTAVQEMYLSVNRFTGGIPDSWAKMTALQTLQVGGMNELCGSIPPSLLSKVKGIPWKTQC